MSILLISINALVVRKERKTDMKCNVISFFIILLSVFFQQQIVADSITTTYSSYLFKGMSDDDLDSGRFVHYSTTSSCYPFRSGFSANNSSDGSASVIAPVARQVSSGLTSATAEIDVWNWSDGLFRCYFYNGVYSVKSYDYVWKSGYDDAVASDYDTLTISINSPYNTGLFNVRCSVPPASDKS